MKQIIDHLCRCAATQSTRARVYAVREVAETVIPYIVKHEIYHGKHLDAYGRTRARGELSWIDDTGEIRVNRGYRIEMNSAIGPHKGGCVFMSRSILASSSFWPLNRFLKMPSQIADGWWKRRTSIPKANQMER